MIGELARITEGLSRPSLEQGRRNLGPFSTSRRTLDPSLRGRAPKRPSSRAHE